MTVAEAKAIARAWAAANLPDWPRVVGVILAGSANFKPDDAPWPGGSDLDLWVFQSGEPSLRLAKFRHAGLILEVASQPADGLGDVEKVLAHPHLAPHFAAGQIVYDPAGMLHDLHRRVAAEAGRRPWVLARMKWAMDNATSKFGKCVASQSPHLVGPLCLFLLGVRNTAALPTIAAQDNPTFRRSLVLQQQHLARIGRLDLHDAVLDVLGVRHFSAEDARDLLPPLGPLYRQACGVVRTPFWAQFELEPAAESLFLDGVTEMIDAGFHREAVFFVLFLHYFCHQAIQTDGNEQQKAASTRLLTDTLARVGIPTVAAMQGRARAGLDLLPRVQAASETLTPQT